MQDIQVKVGQCWRLPFANNPLVLQSSLRCETLSKVEAQQPLDEINGIRRDTLPILLPPFVSPKVDVSSHPSLAALKRCIAREEHEKDNS